MPKDLPLQTTNLALQTLLPSAFLPLAITVIFQTFAAAWYWQHEPFHAFIESIGAAAAIALAVFILIMRHHGMLKPLYLWIATALIGMGVLDGFHAAVDAHDTSFVWLHSLATFLGGLLFTLIMLPKRFATDSLTRYLPAVVALLALIAGTASLLLPSMIPAMLHDESFTLAALLLNVLGGLGFILAWAQLVSRQSLDLDSTHERLVLANHCLIFGIASLLFSVSMLWDAVWWLWHVLRLLAYLIMLVFFMRLYEQAVQRIHISSKAIENCGEAIIIANANGDIMEVNPAYEAITGFSRKEVIGKNPHVLSSGMHRPDFYKNLWNTLLNKHYWEGEIIDRRKDGELFSKWLSISAILNEHKKITYYVGIFQDLTERKKALDEIHQLAFYDPLTRLPNRTLFQEHFQLSLETARRHQHKLALLYFDLDNFKWVNDTLGHLVGDKLLVAVAQRLSQRVRKADLLARLGGDEFTLILEELRIAEEAAEVARTLVELLTQSFEIEGQTIHIGGSVGIAIFPDDGEDCASLIQHADLAMYQAKKEGRNTYHFFSEALQTHAAKRVEMENALRQAIENKEFLMYYQPKVCLIDHSLVGMEALLRWERPGIGLISPDLFIPLAEETGLIIPIGIWVLQEACRQIKIWRNNQCAEFTIAVNLSPRQFKEANFIETLQKIIDDSGICPACLELEVTEGMLMDDVEAAIKRMQTLRDLGIAIAVDDFGTGYSSLSYLKRLPIDTLKIDRSFIQELNQADSAIVDATLNLAHRLGLRVVAEGVEVSEQVHYLSEKGCDEVQGYFFGKPLPASAYPEGQLKQWFKQK